MQKKQGSVQDWRTVTILHRKTKNLSDHQCSLVFGNKAAYKMYSLQSYGIFTLSWIFNVFWIIPRCEQPTKEEMQEYFHCGSSGAWGLISWMCRNSKGLDMSGYPGAGFHYSERIRLDRDTFLWPTEIVRCMVGRQWDCKEAAACCWSTVADWISCEATTAARRASGRRNKTRRVPHSLMPACDKSTHNSYEHCICTHLNL